MDGTPVGKEVPLVVMRPRVITEVVLVVNCFREDKVLASGFGGDSGIGESRNRRLAFLELSSKGAKQSSSLR